MREEQHAAVWPHLEWKITYLQNESFDITIKNNGIGPALISETNMLYNSKKITSLEELLTESVGTDELPHVRGIVENRVISPGEEIQLILVTDPIWSEKLYTVFHGTKSFVYAIDYASIYGEKWVCKGLKVEPR